MSYQLWMQVLCMSTLICVLHVSTQLIWARLGIPTLTKAYPGAEQGGGWRGGGEGEGAWTCGVIFVHVEVHPPGPQHRQLRKVQR